MSTGWESCHNDGDHVIWSFSNTAPVCWCVASHSTYRLCFSSGPVGLQKLSHCPVQTLPKHWGIITLEKTTPTRTEMLRCRIKVITQNDWNWSNWNYNLNSSCYDTEISSTIHRVTKITRLKRINLLKRSTFKYIVHQFCEETPPRFSESMLMSDGLKDSGEVSFGQVSPRFSSFPGETDVRFKHHPDVFFPGNQWFFQQNTARSHSSCYNSIFV